MTERPIAGPVASTARLRSPRPGATSPSKGRTTLSLSPRVKARRPYVTTAVLHQLAQALSDRDRQILATLRLLRVATGDQLERLYFAGTTDRQRRRALERLEAARLIVRLPRQIGGIRAGSTGSVFALDLAGQRLIDHGGPAGGRRIERPWTPGLPFLAHTLAITELYVRLVLADRSGNLELLEFQAEPTAWRRFQGRSGQTTLKPDAALRLGAGPYEDRWFIEVDRGTEAPGTIERKSAIYQAYWSTGREQATIGVFPKVLWLAPDQARADLLADVIDRVSGDSWQLHDVVPFAAAIPRLIQGAGEVSA